MLKKRGNNNKNENEPKGAVTRKSPQITLHNL